MNYVIVKCNVTKKEEVIATTSAKVGRYTYSSETATDACGRRTLVNARKCRVSAAKKWHKTNADAHAVVSASCPGDLIIL